MLKLRDISLRLDGCQILDGIDFDLQPRRLTALVGKNGSGKSTLLSCVNQRMPYTGEIFAGEQDLATLSPKERAKMIAILPQSLPSPHITAEEMVSYGRNPYLDFTGRLTEKDRQVVRQALKEADALELAGRYVDTLSGGEKQKVALAMILAQDTPIILLDEPTAHLDQCYEASILQLLRRLTEEKQKTVLVVLHDLTAAVQFADDMLVLSDGKPVFAGTKEECLQEQILEKTFAVRRYTAQDGENEKIFFSTT